MIFQTWKESAQEILGFGNYRCHKHKKKGVKKAGKTFLRLLPEGREVELSSTRTKDKRVSKLGGESKQTDWKISEGHCGH